MDQCTQRRDRLVLVGAVGVAVLGVCLGAQLPADASGGEVFPGSDGEEIGLGIVELTPDGRRDPVFGPAGRVLPVLHWHGDTFTPPPDAVHLASSARYPQQAFRLGGRAYGLQFHVEVDELSPSSNHASWASPRIELSGSSAAGASVTCEICVVAPSASIQRT